MTYQNLATIAGQSFDKAPSPVTETRRVSFICQSEQERASASVLANILEAANTLAGCELYNVSYIVHPGSSTVGNPTTDRRQQTMIFVGGIEVRWSLPPSGRGTFRHALATGGRVLLIGSAVFLPGTVGLQSDYTLSIHPNFMALMAEECPDLLVSSAPSATSGRISSATTHIAAQKLLVQLISQDHGEFTARAVAAYVGLDGGSTLSSPNGTWKYVRKSSGDSLICDILKLMNEHIEEPLSINDISEITGTSVRNIQRRFKQKAQTSPQSVYREIRLHHARQLIAQSDLPVIDVALSSGFRTYSTFQENFKKHFGSSPTEMRRETYFGCA